MGEEGLTICRGVVLVRDPSRAKRSERVPSSHEPNREEGGARYLRAQSGRSAGQNTGAWTIEGQVESSPRTCGTERRSKAQTTHRYIRSPARVTILVLHMWQTTVKSDMRSRCASME